MERERKKRVACQLLQTCNAATATGASLLHLFVQKLARYAEFNFRRSWNIRGVLPVRSWAMRPWLVCGKFSYHAIFNIPV
jgi:hypothetical protein